MNEKPIVLLVSGEYPPYSSWGGNAYQFQHMAHLLTREDFDVEVIAETDNGEEFMHLDDVGNIVHRVTGARSYFFKAFQKAFPRIGPRLTFGSLAFSMRVLEKALELEKLWNRRILWVESTNWRAETFFFHLIPSLNDRTIVRVVTPFEEVVRQNQIDRSQLGVKVHLFSEWLQQVLTKHRFYSNDDYKSYFESRVKTSFRGWQQATEKTFLLPFDFDRVKPVSPRGNAVPDVIKLLMVGRIETRKGFDTVGSALAGLTPDQRRRIRIQAVGRDTDLGPFKSYKRMLQERFPEIYEECFEWLGTLSDGQLRDVFSSADVGLMASTSESFGYNTLELLASDLPVIASEVGATNEFERRGVRYLGKFRDAAGLARIFAELPTRLAAFRASPPSNRITLMEVYAENDRRYLEYTREQVALRVTDIAGTPTRKSHAPVRSVDLICCTYNRFDELMLSLPSIMREAETATDAGLPTTVYVVYQNEDLPGRVKAARPDLAQSQRLRFVWSNPPGLTRARNVGVAASRGDLVVFIDDDVILEEGFVTEYVRALNSNPGAIGAAGRIKSGSRESAGYRVRAVGQIRPSGFVEPNFDSIEAASTLVPHTSMGANMAYRRAPTTSLLGTSWFDERMPPAAFRDETMLGTELFRRGEHLVYAPQACLYHFESATGGCGFRSKRPIKKLIDHFAMDYLWLNRLYEPVPWLRNVGPALLLRRDLQWAETTKSSLKRIVVNVGGYVKGRRLFARERPLKLVPDPTPEPSARAITARGA